MALVPVGCKRRVNVSVPSVVPHFRMSGSNARTEVVGYGGGTNALCSTVNGGLQMGHAGRKDTHFNRCMVSHPPGPEQDLEEWYFRGLCLK